MKQLIALIILLAWAVPAHAANKYQSVTGNSQSTTSRRAPDKMLYDTASTTATLGMPVYTGYAVQGTVEGDVDWLICKSSEAANVTTTSCVYGEWDERAGYTYV